MFAPRRAAPTKALGYGSNPPLSFRVWGHEPAFTEDAKPWKCLAAFKYLQEALDYIAYCQDRGNDVIFQSPADCTPIKATDRRVVYKPEVA
jgi:hypothetical protein